MSCRNSFVRKKFLNLGQAGMDPDPIEAANIFSELAKQGHPYAQVCYLCLKRIYTKSSY